MFKYSFSYKYLLLQKNNFTTYIEVSSDNNLGKKIFSAKTNLMFKDEFGDWGHACGVGENEDAALVMCINELNSYLKSDSFNKNDLIDSYISLPQKVVYENKGKIIVLLINQIDNQWNILTNSGIKIVSSKCDIIKYIMEHRKEFNNCGLKVFTKEFLAKNGFENTFDKLTVKYKCSVNNKNL